MRNALQEQLLKAGLAKKGRIDQVVREKAKQRRGKAASGKAADSQVERHRQERIERDRALEAERRARVQAHERLAQARQIIDHHRIAVRDGEPYRFIDGDTIASIFIEPPLRPQLARGTLVIVREGTDGYAILPRAAGDQVAERAPQLLVVDHARSAPDTPAGDSDPDADYYARFPVPDDLVW